MQGQADIVVSIAGWMLDPVICAGMTIGAPRVDLAALVERNPHALTLIPDHPKGVGQVDAIVNRRNSELILEQPAEMRRTAEAV